MAQLRVEHRINNDWTLRVGGQYLGGTLAGSSVEANRLLADGRSLAQERRFRDYDWGDLDLQAYLVGRFATGPRRHTLLVGTEFELYRNREILTRPNPATTPFALDIFSPA